MDWKTRQFRVGLAYALRSFFAENGDYEAALKIYDRVLKQDVPLNANNRSLVDRFAFYWQELRSFDHDAYIEARSYWFGIEEE